MKKRNIALLALFAIAIAAVVVVPKLAGAGNQAASIPGGAPGAPGAIPPGSRTSGGPGGRAPGAAAATEFSVRTVVAERTTMQDYIETNGDVVVDSTVKVYPYVSGKLVSSKVSLGSRVAKGQAIAEIDPSTPGSAYTLNAVYAPIAGTVTSLPVSVGSTVSASTAIAEIGSIDELEVEARIPERYVGVLRVGLEASVSLEAYPGVAFAATVSSVSPIVDSTSRTKTIRLAFDRYDARVNAGMFAKIRLDTVSYPDALAVASGGVLQDSTGYYLFVVKDGSTVEKRRVETGADVDGLVEITDGLAEGEVVVVEGASVLADGARVKDISSPEAGK